MLLGGLGMLAGCLSPQQHGAEKQDENQEVIQRLQGIWLDDNTEAPLFKIQATVFIMPARLMPRWLFRYTMIP